MKKSTKTSVITAAVLIGIGLIFCVVAFAAMDFDISHFREVTTVSDVYITEQFSDIEIEGSICDVSFILSGDEQIRVSCRESEKILYDVSVSGDTLTVRERDSRRWYDHIGFSFTNTEVMVHLPEGEYVGLFVNTDTGDINIADGFSFALANFDTDTGDITSGAAFRDSITAKTDTGGLVMENAGELSGDIRIETSTGDIKLSDANCRNFTLESDTGDVILDGLVASGKIGIETDTGDIDFIACDADSLHIQSDTGDVTGTLLSEKIIYAESDTGRVDVPRSTSGGKCEIETDTGDIRIGYVP